MPIDTSINHNDRLSAIRNNDEKALKTLYQANYPGVEKYVLDNSGSVDEAKDIYQEAFIIVWQNIQLDKFRPQHHSSLEAYIYQVAKYKWLDHLRRIKRQDAHLNTAIATEETSVHLDKQEEDYLTKVKTQYATMREPCRNVLYRFYFLKQSINEIATIFSWTEATAKNNKYRCLQKLRSMVLSKNMNP